MDPSSVLNSLTGVVAIVMIFGLPILAVIATLAIVLAVVNRRHRERMKMIEQGMIPPPPRKQTGRYYGLLISGAILLAFGLALFIAELASRSNDLEGGLIFGFIGLALLACFAFIRVVRKKEMPPADPSKPTEIPPQS